MALTTENWIALFAIYTVVLAAVLMTMRHRYRQQVRQYRDLENAYRQQEREVSERTQSLRATNSELYQEIQQRELGAQQLRAAQTYLNSIIDSMPSVVIGVTSDGRITHWNTQARLTTGCGNDAIGQYLWEVYPALPVDLLAIQQAIASHTPSTREACKLVSGAETHYLDITVYPLQAESGADHPEAIIQASDVTVRVLMEKNLVQNEKLLSLGELAAGVAHEINNPLGAILQHVQNIERRTSAGLAQNQMAAEQAGTRMEAIEKYLEERQVKKLLHGIREAGERSARLVANMLDFSYKSQPQVPTAINRLVEDCLALSANQLRVHHGDSDATIAVVLHLDESLPDVTCSPAEIQQVILNLLRNAAQCFNDPASPPVSSPTITVTTGREAKSVVIQIRDNGPGMPDHVRQHAFEPFFTTKPVGQGTGLGLSISYFIITRHHRGRIDVESAPGGGTCFSVRLPLSPQHLLLQVSR